MAELGHEVLGMDCDMGKVAILNSGKAPFHERDLDDTLARHTASGRLKFTASYAEATGFADLHFIGVGTPQKAWRECLRPRPSVLRRPPARTPSEGPGPRRGEVEGPGRHSPSRPRPAARTRAIFHIAVRSHVPSACKPSTTSSTESLTLGRVFAVC
ncbi:hypothetical protein ACWD48_11655 [Streptomyces sp. NPDC002519]